MPLADWVHASDHRLGAPYLHKYPFIRLTIPWMAGIGCGDTFFDRSIELFVPVCLFVCLAILAICIHYNKRYSLRWCFGAFISALCFTGGWIGITTHLHSASTPALPAQEMLYSVELTDVPQRKERSLLCPVLLKEYRDAAGGHHPINRRAILYLSPDSATSLLTCGDQLLVAARISLPVSNRNFDEFDYPRYLLRKGISGTGYVPSGKWQLLASGRFTETSSSVWGHLDIDRLRLWAYLYRDRLIALYRHIGFSGDELAVLSALTVGDKTELSEELREGYSVAGASHVLALSGLHIGILYVLLYFLLTPIARSGWMGKCLCTVLLIFLFWAFAFFTGLSPSVVRSVGMYSLLVLAQLAKREPLSLNTLAAVAFLMLCFYPAWLFDVGFQLSFLAVTAILLFQKPIYGLLRPRFAITRYVWGLISVSIAVQIGTAPLVILYFSRFSTHFLLTNLVVIPLVALILYATLFMLLLTPFPGIQIKVGEGVGKLLEGLNDFVHTVEQLPCASIDGLRIYPTEIIGIYIALFLLCRYYWKRRYRMLLTALSFILLLGVYHAVLVWMDRPRSSLIFYNVRGCPAVHFVEDDGSSRLHLPDSQAITKPLQQAVARYRNCKRLLLPETVLSDLSADDCFRWQQVIASGACRVCMVTDDRWHSRTTDSPLPVHYLYLCNGYNGHIGELTRLFSFSCVVLDASLPEYRKERFKEECRQAGWQFISLSEQGSVCFLL